MANNAVRSLTKSEERSLFATIRQFKDDEAERDLNWMLLIRYTARRVEAIHMLNAAEAEQALDSGYLHIKSENQKGGKKGKDKSQDLYLVDKAKTALKALLAVRRRMLARRLGEPCDDSALLLSRRGQRLSIRSMQHRMAYWCDKANIVKASPHWLRHTWAVRRLQNASGNKDKALREVQEVLGHKFITTTQIYTQPNRDDINHAMMEAAL
jgi:site-specific recombinase XerC